LEGSVIGTAWASTVLRRSTTTTKMDENGQKTGWNEKSKISHNYLK
jgi:hypothetical protein